jgi:DNA-directed RNA polymerase subunit RPC12/RpoP
MGEYSFRPYFTLFFIPVFPIAKGESMMVCSRCGATFYSQAENHHPDDDGVEQKSEGDMRAIINCKYCSGRMRVPVGEGRKLLVTCPHCRKRFDA